jgi:ribulose-phosphate 3-epimerase
MSGQTPALETREGILQARSTLMNGSEVVAMLRAAAPVIAPSMLKCDFASLGREFLLLEAAGAKVFHWDVMDGHFVPNLTYGPVLLKAARTATRLPFDAHLMISDPARYLDEFLDAGCELITFHVEAVPDPVPLLNRVRRAGAAAGLALNPGTGLEAVLPALAHCDLVLVMSVEPGFGGQAFKREVLEKVRRLQTIAGNEVLISIDGGIGPQTISAAAQAGAKLFVAGSALFDTQDYQNAMDQLLIAAGGAAVTATTE